MSCNYGTSEYLFMHLEAPDPERVLAVGPKVVADVRCFFWLAVWEASDCSKLKQ